MISDLRSAAVTVIAVLVLTVNAGRATQYKPVAGISRLGYTI